MIKNRFRVTIFLTKCNQLNISVYDPITNLSINGQCEYGFYGYKFILDKMETALFGATLGKNKEGG